MASPQANTKIERAVEAVEGLAVAVVAAQGNLRVNERATLFNNVRDARQELRDAFADFLSPVLRVVTPEGQ